MTSRDLAERIAPKVRAAMEVCKEDVLGQYPMVKRIVVRPLWPLIMGVNVPIMTRVVIEFLLSLYQRHLKAYVGPFVDAYLATLEDPKDERLAQVRDFLSLLQTHHLMDIIKTVEDMDQR